MIRLNAMAAPAPPRRLFRFGLFEFDPTSRELRKQGMKVRLQGQPVDILAMLLARPGEVVTREEFQRCLWNAGTFVDFERSLNAAVKRLRAALGDSAEAPRFVETLSRRGYRFIAPVHVSVGEFGPSQEEPAPRQPPTIPRWLGRPRTVLLAVLGMLSIIAAIAVIDNRDWGKRAKSSSASINSLVVLPLRDLSGASEQEYFAEGLADELRAQLAGVSALRVISQTSSLRYKGAQKAISQIARELGVDAVVEGSVLRAGDQVRINVQLIQAEPERRIWGKSYERSMRDVLVLQNDVARAIVDEMRVKLTASEKVRMSTVRSSNPEAHLEYVKGRFYWNKRTEDGLAKSIDCFQRAIQRDPKYALAYAGLADSWVPMAWYGYRPPGKAFPQAKEAVTQALTLDPGLAEAHTTLAFITLYYDWDWAGAEREFLRAIELNPNYANAHHWYAEYLSLVGRHDAAIQESERARELDPLSSIINTWVGSRYFYARRYDMAIEQYRSVAERDPDFVPVHLGLGQAYEQKHMLQEAIAELRRGVTLSGSSPVYVAALAHAYGSAGRTNDALQLFRHLELQSSSRYVAYFDIATAFLGIGDKARALASLERAVEEHSPRLLFLSVDPRFDVLRHDVRFMHIARSVGSP